MKRFITVILSLSLILSVFTHHTAALCQPSVSAEGAVLIEADSKDVIYSKNHLRKMPMASTTKIMTALVVLERLPLDHVFTVSDTAVGTEGSSAYLKKGDAMTVSAALYALLLQSANDVSVALALEVAGSMDGFSDLMNKKAKELGLKNTAFKNSSGLPCDGHYTTAYDFAILGAAAMENDNFYRIVSSRTATVTIGGEDRTFVNHNKLLSLYDGTVGIKTGYTKESGRCLVSACEKNGVRLICVTLNAPDDWNDHQAMFDYGLSKYKSVCLCNKDKFFIELPVAGDDGYVVCAPSQDQYITLKNNTKITVSIEAKGILVSPVKKGDAVALAVFSADNRIIATVDLIALTDT